MHGLQQIEQRSVREVGEFGLIALLTGALPEEVRQDSRVAIGIGDDAAVWRPTDGASVVVTTDSLVEGIHFRLDWTDWKRLGHKSLAVNVSDLASMGATPKVAVVTLALRGDEHVRDLQALYVGLGSLALRHGMVVVGGDIVRSPHGLAIHVTALGESINGRVLTRSGAMPGDLLGVSGTLGASAAGMQLLHRESDDPRRRATTADMLIDAHLIPEPRVRLGQILLEAGATAAMDLSDGLLGDLPKILEASGVSSVVDARLIPVAASVRALFPNEWLELVLRGGEDYELLFTAPREAWQRIAEAAAATGVPVTAIGTVVERENREAIVELIGLDGTRQVIPPGAFDHFLAP